MRIHLFRLFTIHYIYICLSYMYPCPAYSYIFFMVCLPIKIHLLDKLLLIDILKKYPEIQDKKYLDELLTMYNHRNCVGYKEWVSDAYPNIEEIAQTVLELRYVNSYLGAFCIDNPDIGLCINLEDMTLLENDYKELFDLFKSLKTCVELASSIVPIDLEGVGLKVCEGTNSISRPTVSPKL